MNRFFHALRMILCLIMLWGTTRLLEAATTYHPVAAVKPLNGSLFLLTTEGTVLALNLNLNSGSVVGRFSFHQLGYPSDMTYGVAGSQEMLFVGSSFSTPGGVVQGRVQAFTTDGKPLRFWSTSHVVGGLAFDAGSQTLYFTSGDSPDVFAISPLSDASPRFVGEVNGATKLGSITIDSARHQFYISDVDQGTVFSMSLSTRHVATIGRVGTPSALLMNMSGSQLIVADSARKQVIGLSVGDPNVAPHPLTPPRSFKGPSGLAWEDSSHLIVSDELAGSVTLLDATGKTMYSLTLH